MSKKDLTKKEIDVLAGAFVMDMIEAGLTKSQMLEVLKLAREKYERYKNKKQ